LRFLSVAAFLAGITRRGPRQAAVGAAERYLNVYTRWREVRPGVEAVAK